MTMKNLKKIQFITCFVFISALFTGCDKEYFDTQPDNLLSVEGIFSNRTQTERWWAGLFSSIPDIWDQPYGFIYGITSDENDASNWTNPGMNSGAITPDGTPSNFSALYEKIRLATIFLERVDSNKEILDLVNGEELIKNYKGEARFLRAFYYWTMMKQLGPVAIAPLVAGKPEDNFQIPRSTWDESVNFVLSEIEKAKLDLPADYYLTGTTTVDGAQVGRINTIIATALESQILLYHASPLFNGNTELADFKNLDGTVLFNQVYDASRWANAAAKAKAAIDLAESNGKSLFKVADANPFRAAFLSVRDLYWDGWKTEGIWLRPATGNYNWEIHCSPRSTDGTAYNGIAVVQSLVDEYRMADGKKITESTTYNETTYASAATPYYVAGTNVMYTNREPRFYAQVTFNGALNPGKAKAGASNSRVEFFASGTSGKSASPRDWPKTGYTARKNIHPTFNVSTGSIGRPAMLIRLAELYLNYAEALNESSPGNADILIYLNKIKTRAGVPALASGLSQSEIRDEIRHERRIELSFEGHRYFDVRRWKIADLPGSNQGGAFYGMDMNKGAVLSDPAFHKRTLSFSRTPWQRKCYFMPYGQNEMDRNKQLVQFPGY
jgi:hypothetical protein